MKQIVIHDHPRQFRWSSISSLTLSLSSRCSASPQVTFFSQFFFIFFLLASSGLLLPVVIRAMLREALLVHATFSILYFGKIGPPWCQWGVQCISRVNHDNPSHVVWMCSFLRGGKFFFLSPPCFFFCFFNCSTCWAQRELFISYQIKVVITCCYWHVPLLPHCCLLKWVAVYLDDLMVQTPRLFSAPAKAETLCGP